MTGPLDATDLKTARAAVAYYMRGHQLVHKPIPPAAVRLAAHLEQAMSANGLDSVVPQPHWITTTEAARQLGCTPRHARRIAQQIGHRIGRQWLIDPDALPEDD
jgi:hypothetical protein